MSDKKNIIPQWQLDNAKKAVAKEEEKRKAIKSPLLSDLETQKAFLQNCMDHYDEKRNDFMIRIAKLKIDKDRLTQQIHQVSKNTDEMRLAFEKQIEGMEKYKEQLQKAKDNISEMLLFGEALIAQKFPPKKLPEPKVLEKPAPLPLPSPVSKKRRRIMKEVEVDDDE